ncbi:cell wall-active antibiotics response protein LiaF [Bacillus sp. HMF5848]|uniref:cell wall-active antibiotics response protein LiaF n=1 Tax=Bacillus sp. HMF5848 TaxID=2495421 RepID=UPI00163AC9E0|nr:cell wall-active antibiotics response protein LiaF [Bacillus sp. HMF5848]
MNDKSKSLVVATILVGLGVLLIFVNIGVISFGIWELFVNFYPVLFLIIGSSGIAKAIRSRGHDGLFSALFFTTAGLLLILDRLGVIFFELRMVWQLWPVILVYLGIKALLGDMLTVTVDTDDKDVAWIDDEDYNTVKKGGRFSIGDIKFSKPDWQLEPLHLKNGIGDYYFDLTKAYIPDMETPIYIEGTIGDVKMLIPDDLPVKVHAYVKIGDVRVMQLKEDGTNRQVTYVSDEYDQAIRKVNIHIRLKIGSVKIDSI